MGRTVALHKGFPRRRALRAGAVFTLGALSLSAPVLAEGPAPGGDAPTRGLWDTVLEGLNIRAKPGRAPDFVEATRPDPSKLHFLPTTEPHPPGSTPAKTPAEIANTKARLDAARAAQLLPKPPPLNLLRPPKLSLAAGAAKAKTTAPAPKPVEAPKELSAD